MDPDRIRKIEGLLAKASHPNTPQAEAEAAAAMAERLMYKWAIDESMLNIGSDTDPIGTRVVTLRGAYLTQQRALLVNITKAFGVRWIYSQGSRVTIITMYGRKNMIERSMTLFATLSAQMTNLAAQQRPKSTWYDDPSPAQVRSYRAAYMDGFALRVGQRLREMTAEVDAEMSGSDADRLALVRVGDADKIQAMIDEAHPDLSKTRARKVANRGAMGAGIKAGATVAIHQNQIGDKRLGIGTGR